jgi:LysR family hydrogen peroxide-inducible transcriptional activator
MITLQQMNYILALADFGQFQKASEFCNVTQPTLSMQVKKAEEMLGHPVFERGHARVKLSPFGESLIPVLRDMKQENERIIHLSQSFSGKRDVQLSVGIIPTISAYLVPELFKISESLGRNTLHVYEFHTHELIRKLESRQLDLAILAGPYQQPSFRSVKLFEEELKVYSKDHIKGGVIKASELHDRQPWMLSEGNCLRSQMVSFCALEGNTDAFGSRYEGNQLELLLKMVDMHGGYTMVPEFYPLSQAIEESLCSVKIEDNGNYPGRTIIGVYSSKSIHAELFNRLIYEIQHTYMPVKTKHLELLGWRGG